MPEGDTVHKIAAALRPRLEGRTLAAARLRDRPDRRLDGRRVEAVTVHGKHLLVAFDDGTVLRSHLGMHGDWHRYRPGERWRRPARQAAIVLETGDEVLVCFNASEVELLAAGGLRARDLHARLGPDLLGDAPDLASIPGRARELLDPAAPLADVLLDQRVASGIGNVYKSEVLFIERMHPARVLADTSDAALARLFETAARLLARNLGPGRRVTRFENDGRGSLWVYGRARRPCLRCGEPVRYARLGRDLRATWWCDRCQRLG